MILGGTARFSRAAAGGGFTPGSRSGKLLLLDADLLTAGAVATWADTSGSSGHNVTQATGANQPVAAVDAGYNGHKTVAFDGNTQYLQSGTWGASQSQPLTVYVVGEAVQDVTHCFFSGIASGNRIDLYSTFTDAAIFSGNASAQAASTNTSKSVFCGVFNSPTCAVYRNDHTVPVASGDSGTNTLTGTTIGAFFNVSALLNGKIAYVFVVSGADSLAQRSQVFGYLGTRYAISVT